MITSLPMEQLVLLGQTVSARRVLDQARYTLAQVSGDPAMRARLGAAYLSELDGAVVSLEEAIRKRYGARWASLEATAAQNYLVQQGRRYRRALVSELAAARLAGVELPVQATRTGGRTASASVLAADLDRLLATALPVAAELARVGVTAEFLGEGASFVRRLRDGEERQELARRAQQIAAVAHKCEMTGVVLTALRGIVAVSKAVHRNDRLAAAEYTLCLLRGPRAVEAAEEVAVAETAGAAAPAGAEEAVSLRPARWPVVASSPGPGSAPPAPAMAPSMPSPRARAAG